MESAFASKAPGNAPKMATRLPGATAVPCPCASLVKLPASSTPPVATLGACAESVAAHTIATPVRINRLKYGWFLKNIPQEYGKLLEMNRADETGLSSD